MDQGMNKEQGYAKASQIPKINWVRKYRCKKIHRWFQNEFVFVTIGESVDLTEAAEPEMVTFPVPPQVQVGVTLTPDFSKFSKL